MTTPTGETVQPEQVLGESRAGRRVVFSGDTRPCEGVLAAAHGADLLVHESSSTEEDAERAAETNTPHARGGHLARTAEVRLLALTHLGQRARASDVNREAREQFSDTVVPRGFDIIDVPRPERGAPTLERGAEWAGPRHATWSRPGRWAQRRTGGGHGISGLVTVAVAGDARRRPRSGASSERAGIESQLEGAEDEFVGTPVDGPCHILVAAPLLDAADALADNDEEEEEEL